VTAGSGSTQFPEKFFVICRFIKPNEELAEISNWERAGQTGAPDYALGPTFELYTPKVQW